MSTPAVEQPDYHIYDWISFDRDTFQFYLAAVRFYETLLEADVKAMEEDEDLRVILGSEALDSYPIAKELQRVRRVHQWFDKEIAKAGADPLDYNVSVSHEWVRFVKSVSILYLEHLRRRRHVIASRPFISKAMLEAVDQQLAHFDEKTQIGVFRAATPYPITVGQLPEIAAEPTPSVSQDAVSLGSAPPRPVVLGSIEIRDRELRKRCLDLLAQFREDGQHDRLDTVVNEATRILEDRLRLLSGAPATCVGVDLAKFAFSPPDPRLVLHDN